MDINNREEIESLLGNSDTVLNFKELVEKVSKGIIDENLQKQLGEGLVKVFMHIDDFEEPLIELLDKIYSNIVEQLKKL